MLIVGVMALFLILTHRPYLGLPLFYLAAFVRDYLYSSLQVRYKTAMNVGIIVLCLAAAAFNQYISSRKGRGSARPAFFPEFTPIRWSLIIVIVTGAVNGALKGYRPFAIAVDVYKILEILLFYYFIIWSIRSVEDADRTLDILTVEMCVMGIIEIFTTTRGNIGLNILMSFFPIMLSTGLETGRRRLYPVLIAAVAILFACKTRTYMLGGIAAFAIVFTLSYGARQLRIKAQIITLIGIVTAGLVVYIQLTGNDYFTSIIGRIAALSEGFESAGGYRIYEIRTAIGKFLGSPVVGTGYGYVEWLYIETMGRFAWGDFMHNAYVEILAKSGVAGAVFLFSSLGYFMNRLWREVNSARDGMAAAVLKGGFAAAVSWLIVYAAAPLSSYGYIFISAFFALAYGKLSEEERAAD